VITAVKQVGKPGTKSEGWIRQVIGEIKIYSGDCGECKIVDGYLYGLINTAPKTQQNENFPEERSYFHDSE
jgi:hypothetical protein